MNDSIRRFMFDQLDVRGAIVQLADATEAIQETHHYPAALAILLNEFTAAVCLLRDSIKVDADITIQLRSEGAISLIMADCVAGHRVRAIAEYDRESLLSQRQISLNEFSEGAVLAITISPLGGERYQGVVPIECASLAACLEDYFARSEQLPTWFKLLANDKKAVGIAIHALPSNIVVNQAEAVENFTRIRGLLSTLKVEEALNLSSEQILTRLFHEESCRIFEPRHVEFGCECTRQKSLDAIASLGGEEIDDMLSEHKDVGKDKVIVDCHFCFQRYEFSFEEVARLLSVNV